MLRNGGAHAALPARGALRGAARRGAAAVPFVESTVARRTDQPAACGFPVPHVDIEVVHRVRSVGAEVTIRSADIIEATDACWNPNNTEVCYQAAPADFSVFAQGTAPLSPTEIAVCNALGDLATRGRDLMHAGELKDAIREQPTSIKGHSGTGVDTAIIRGIASCLAEQDATARQAKARALHDMFIAIGWLEKYWMFQDYFSTSRADSHIPAAIGRVYEPLALLFGSHPEFTYYGHYVGSSAANNEDVRRTYDNVDFNDSASMVRWVQSFQPVYSFQPESRPAALAAELYFRFIHLAMEIVHSRFVPQVFAKLREATPESVYEALSLQRESERRQNQVFKTLPIGSDPALYNSHVRPYIAGTWGDNCGTVFDTRGKFFEGTAAADGSEGRWRKHVGQTGAGTSARPIGDELAGGVTGLYDGKELSLSGAELVEALMLDRQEEVQRIVSGAQEGALTVMLAMFRGMTRPYSHNQQIVTARSLLHNACAKCGENDPRVVAGTLELQLAAVLHRVDHYRFVKKYINSHATAGKQRKTVATGGSDTTRFLPDLIDENLRKANVMLTGLRGIGLPETDAASERYDQYATLIREHHAITDRIRDETRRIKAAEA